MSNEIIAALILSLPGLGALLWNLIATLSRKRVDNSEARGIDADTAIKYQKLADDAGKALLECRRCMIEAEAEANQLKVLTDRIPAMEARIKRLETILKAYNIPYPEEDI